MLERVPNICSPIKRGWAAVFKISRLYTCSIWICCDSLKLDILDTRITDEMLNLSAKKQKGIICCFFHIVDHLENIISNLSHKGRKFILFQHILLCNVSLITDGFYQIWETESVFHLNYYMQILFFLKDALMTVSLMHNLWLAFYDFRDCSQHLN